MVRRLLMVAVAVAFVMAMALPASAGPSAATTYTATNFPTGALDANGDWKLVFCSFAKLTLLDGKANETYRCKFEEGAELPDHAMTWNYENSLPFHGPWRWYSDVEELTDIATGGDPLCFMYTSAKGQPPGDSSWSLVITPSGNANATVKYRSPVWETADGLPCTD